MKRRYQLLFLLTSDRNRDESAFKRRKQEKNKEKKSLIRNINTWKFFPKIQEKKEVSQNLGREASFFGKSLTKKVVLQCELKALKKKFRKLKKISHLVLILDMVENFCKLRFVTLLLMVLVSRECKLLAKKRLDFPFASVEKILQGTHLSCLKDNI